MNPQTDTPESAEAMSARIAVEEACKNIAVNEVNFLRRRENMANDVMKLALPDFDATNEPLYNAIARLATERDGYKGGLALTQGMLEVTNEEHAQQSDTPLKLQRCEEALRGMEALATGEGWNTPIFSAPFGAALREARAALAMTHPARNEGEKKV